jgi:hypothetical protein
MPKKVRFPHEPGKCRICADRGILPSEAVACVLHSEIAINELKTENTTLKRGATASQRLHFALADMAGSVPSPDGSEELAFVREMHDRIERLSTLLRATLDVAEYEIDGKQLTALALKGIRRTDREALR